MAVTVVDVAYVFTGVVVVEDGDDDEDDDDEINSMFLWNPLLRLLFRFDGNRLKSFKVLYLLVTFLLVSLLYIRSRCLEVSGNVDILLLVI